MLGSGIYFIDVLACLLFCVVLALVGARFGSERSVTIDLPALEPNRQSGADLAGASLQVRTRDGRTEILLGEETLGLDELGQRLRSAPPPALVVRAEDSDLARVIAIAHAAGVHDIELAYEVRRGNAAGSAERAGGGVR
jgi:hypothetical protein